MSQDFLIERLRKEIEGFESSANAERVGTVVRVGDGIAEVEGLDGAMMSEMVELDTAEGKTLEASIASAGRISGLVLNLEEDSVKIVVLGDANAVREGMAVKSTGTILSIPVSAAMVGRVVNPLGEPMDGKGPITAEKRMAIERVAYGVIDRDPVNVPLHTGIKAIDAMIPIGRGQRELIIGDRATGKTSIAVDAILNQLSEPKEQRPICIYVAIGQKEAKVARLVHELSQAGAMEYTIVVSAPASAPAPFQFLAPFAGAAIGEYFMEQGKDALAVYDDLSKHAVAYRQMSLLLRRPPGREAYPGDIFYLHSRLLERAAKLSKARGGGSLTALPIIETQQGDVSAYIPTNVISITDGQIYLEPDLFYKGVRPAINVGLSVSRVGSNAQTKAMKSVAGKIRLELAQYRELEAFTQFSQDLDEDTKKRLEIGGRLAEVLKQVNSAPVSFEREAAVIYAAINGLFEAVSIAQVLPVEAKLLAYLEHQRPEILSGIREKKAFDTELEEKFKKALEDFQNTHPEFFEKKNKEV